jgi:hypothetical protein
MIEMIENSLDQVLFPGCEKGQCPFRGCMGDNTCKIFNVKNSAPHLIEEFATLINYCDRPRLFLKNKNEDM